MWEEYRRTWKIFASRLGELQQCEDPVEKERLSAAVEVARAEHNVARQELAEHLTSRERRVRNTARLIWEFSGRPEGTAEADWAKAEKVWK